MRNSQFAELLNDKRTPATVLLVGLLDEFGTEFFTWEPQTLILELQSQWKSKPPTVNRDKIWALVTFMTTNLFYTSFECFNHTCQALSSSEADFENYDPADVQDICWAIAETTLLNPPEKSDVFNSEILVYMEKRLQYEGFQKVPKLLAKYVKLPENTEEVNLALTEDGIDFKAHHDTQQRKLLEMDQAIQVRLASMVEIIAGLPLRNADQEALAELKARAAKALARQTQETKQVSQSAAASPIL